MARYIDADKFREKAFFADTEADITHYIRLYGYDDVVPKSEVERLRGELARANRMLREIKQAHRRCNHWKLAQIIEGDEL